MAASAIERNMMENWNGKKNPKNFQLNCSKWNKLGVKFMLKKFFMLRTLLIKIVEKNI